MGTIIGDGSGQGSGFQQRRVQGAAFASCRSCLLFQHTRHVSAGFRRCITRCNHTKTEATTSADQSSGPMARWPDDLTTTWGPGELARFVLPATGLQLCDLANDVLRDAPFLAPGVEPRFGAVLDDRPAIGVRTSVRVSVRARVGVGTELSWTMVLLARPPAPARTCVMSVSEADRR